MLSKYGLYPVMGGALLPGSYVTKLDLRLWLLFFCDGEQPLYKIARRLDVPISFVIQEANLLQQNGLLVQLS